ncbi:hypothetical protein DPEC_G00282180 [Dallia pectoralis]|uniref:Uncharacterized protein n=1 Tax=Dallia pectoralis TaxID=75939 RepID=A0ACC2FN38_DALPE|nr:hypothetical protein DPEC_G00282180 [Dallia pectoralis]
MAACASTSDTPTVAAGPRLVGKDDARSEIWKYFAYLADSEGEATDKLRPVCCHCKKQIRTKGANTSNLAKHLADKHAELHKEFKDRQKSAATSSERATPQRQQPTLQAMFEQHNKYPRESKEVKRLNKAVAEFICLDQVPVYVVEKAGFRNLVQNLDKRSNKTSRLLKDKQKSLNLPQHASIHDEPTQWGSTYDMVERFCEQQQAVSAVLAEDRKKWHLMPRDTDMTTLEIVRDVLAPLSDFTDALSDEKETTISSVLPLMWKIKACLKDDRPLALEMKNKIRGDFEKRWRLKHRNQVGFSASEYHAT